MSVVLRGITWDHPRGLGSVEAAGAAYAAVQPDVEVRWEARSLQSFADQSLTDLTAEYDLLVIDHPHIPLAHRDELLLTLEGRGHDADLDVQAARSVGRSHESYAVDGHQYALAVDAATQVAVHRPDLLPEPPRTWDAVLELAREGRVLWPAKPVDAISSFLTLSANLGSPVGSRPGVFVDPAVGSEVLGRLHRLAELVPEDCLDENPIQTAERLAGADTWSYAPLAYGYTNYGRAGFRRHRLAYVDMPRGEGGLVGSNLGGAGIAVSARCRHAEQAVAHAFWLASDDVQRGVYFDGGGQPGNAAAWDDDRLDDLTLGFFSGTRATLEAAGVRPRTTGWLDVQEQAGNLVNAALRGEMDDRACLSRVQEVYERSFVDEGIAP